MNNDKVRSFVHKGQHFNCYNNLDLASVFQNGERKYHGVSQLLTTTRTQAINHKFLQPKVELKKTNKFSRVTLSCSWNYFGELTLKGFFCRVAILRISSPLSKWVCTQADNRWGFVVISHYHPTSVDTKTCGHIATSSCGCLHC
jgi:hypothetical protein